MPVWYVSIKHSCSWSERMNPKPQNREGMHHEFAAKPDRIDHVFAARRACGDTLAATFVAATVVRWILCLLCLSPIGRCKAVLLAGAKTESQRSQFLHDRQGNKQCPCCAAK